MKKLSATDIFGENIDKDTESSEQAYNEQPMDTLNPETRPLSIKEQMELDDIQAIQRHWLKRAISSVGATLETVENGVEFVFKTTFENNVVTYTIKNHNHTGNSLTCKVHISDAKHSELYGGNLGNAISEIQRNYEILKYTDQLSRIIRIDPDNTFEVIYSNQGNQSAIHTISNEIVYEAVGIAHTIIHILNISQEQSNKWDDKPISKLEVYKSHSIIPWLYQSPTID